MAPLSASHQKGLHASTRATLHSSAGHPPAEDLLNEGAAAARQACDKNGLQVCHRSCTAAQLLLPTATQQACQTPQQPLARSAQCGGNAGRRLRLPLLLLLLLLLLLGVIWCSSPWLLRLPFPPSSSSTNLPLLLPLIIQAIRILLVSSSSPLLSCHPSLPHVAGIAAGTAGATWRHREDDCQVSNHCRVVIRLPVAARPVQQLGLFQRRPCLAVPPAPRQTVAGR